jgi:hypothetical protein
MLDIIYALISVWVLGFGLYLIGRLSNRNHFEFFAYDWTVRQALTKEMWRCIRNNRQNTLAFISLITILLSGGIAVSLALSSISKNPTIMIKTAIFTTVFAIVLIASVFVFRWLPYKKSTRIAKQTRSSNNFIAHKEHDGFIIIRYRNISLNLYLVDCIDLLVRGYALSRKQWKIYCCSTKENFIEVYKNPNVTGLWIIGHGQKNHLSFDQGALEYRELPKGVQRKEFIAQLTCNPGPGPSIIEINNPKQSYISDYLRIPMQNRCFIIERLHLNYP